jgi:Restriction endonuclease NaeI
VLAWLSAHPVEERIGTAVRATVDYVLDGARTGRFELDDPRVDSDERRSVGTKLQYHVLEELGLPKERRPDTHIEGVEVDVKTTVRRNWSIPREAHCQICLLIRIDADLERHRAWLMRTHFRWLHQGKGNRDQKRGIVADALRRYAVPLYDEAPYPDNPLRRLSDADLAVVFERDSGQERRLVELFRRLPDVVFPRSAIETVGFGHVDPIRRARAVRARLHADHEIELLCGRWTEDRRRAAERGHDLPDGAWLALSPLARVGPSARRRR